MLLECPVSKAYHLKVSCLTQIEFQPQFIASRSNRDEATMAMIYVVLLNIVVFATTTTAGASQCDQI